ncbi:MAG: GNAT family N-acetyltransferase [Burkholderiaceae bacterium]
MPGTTALRPATRADARAMAEMSRDLIEAGLPWRYTPPRMAALVRDRDTMALVASEGGHLHGMAVMHFGDEDAHLVLLCVQPAQRHRGIGRGLLQWLLESARVAGIARIGVELRADNASALAFYQRLGFAQTAWLPHYYDGRLPGRRMRLKLAAPSDEQG